MINLTTRYFNLLCLISTCYVIFTRYFHVISACHLLCCINEMVQLVTKLCQLISFFRIISICYVVLVCRIYDLFSQNFNLSSRNNLVSRIYEMFSRLFNLSARSFDWYIYEIFHVISKCHYVISTCYVSITKFVNEILTCHHEVTTCYVVFTGEMFSRYFNLYSHVIFTR